MYRMYINHSMSYVIKKMSCSKLSHWMPYVCICGSNKWPHKLVSLYQADEEVWSAINLRQTTLTKAVSLSTSGQWLDYVLYALVKLVGWILIDLNHFMSFWYTSVPQWNSAKELCCLIFNYGFSIAVTTLFLQIIL